MTHIFTDICINLPISTIFRAGRIGTVYIRHFVYYSKQVILFAKSNVIMAVKLAQI